MTDAKDRPILMSAPMVRAILDGRKTQTRRIAKITAIMGNRVSVGPHEELVELDNGEFSRGVMHYSSTSALSGPYPIGYAVGDRAWVRETWARHTCAEDRIYAKGDGHPWGTPIYRATFGAMLAPVCEGFTPWRPSIHMPRWASRLTLLIEDVRVQRLQDISEEDAQAEGVEWDIWDQAIVTKNYSRPDGRFITWPIEECEDLIPVDDDGVFRRSFSTLWNSIHGPDAWAQNPWVAALTFRPILANIDSLKEAA